MQALVKLPMSITVTGKIERQDFGFGTWSLVSDDGQIYELKDPPSALCQAHDQVQVIGQVHEDAMSIAMVGPLLEVISFEVLAG